MSVDTVLIHTRKRYTQDILGIALSVLRYYSRPEKYTQDILGIRAIFQLGLSTNHSTVAFKYKKQIEKIKRLVKSFNFKKNDTLNVPLPGSIFGVEN